MTFDVGATTGAGYVQTTGSHYDFGGTYIGGSGSPTTPNLSAGAYYGFASTFQNSAIGAGNAMDLNGATGVFDCTNCVINGTNAGIIFGANGATANLRGDTKVTGTTLGALYNVGFASVTVYSEPTVTFSPTTFPNFTGTWIGPTVQSGSCTGTATAGQATPGLSLYPLGSPTTTTCTSAAGTAGYVVATVGKTGVLSYLRATSSAAGVNASSGVVTVYKNNVATTITCTIGTGTSCTDNTHSVAYALGDIITINFTTQAAETLANVRASVNTL